MQKLYEKPTSITSKAMKKFVQVKVWHAFKMSQLEEETKNEFLIDAQGCDKLTQKLMNAMTGNGSRTKITKCEL